MQDRPLLKKVLIDGPLFIATGNKGKLAEIEPMIREYFEVTGPIDGLNPDGAVEDAETFEDNALIKARHAQGLLPESQRGSAFVLSDDSGLSVDALEGAPGVRSARYAGEDASSEEHMQKLLCSLKALDTNESTFAAHYTCCLALLRGSQEWLGVGECHGEITFEASGNSGFGYDPIFFSPQFGKTFAEISYEQKNSISHRRKAFESLQTSLRVKS